MRFAPLLFVLLTLGATPLRAAPPDFARWETDIQAFEEQDRKSPPAPGGLLFVGSSSIRLWKLDEAFPELHAINRGFGGSEVADSVHFADRIVLPYRPRMIVFYAGDNDVANGKSAEQVFADVKEFVAKVHDALPETKILYLPIKPSRSRWSMIETQREANRLVEKFAEENEQLEYLDTSTPLLGADGLPRPELFEKDELHLNAEGYRVWNEILAPHLAAPAR